MGNNCDTGRLSEHKELLFYFGVTEHWHRCVGSLKTLKCHQDTNVGYLLCVTLSKGTVQYST